MIHNFGYKILCLNVVDIHTQYICVNIEVDFDIDYDFKFVWTTPLSIL